MITIDGEEYYGWASQAKVDFMKSWGIDHGVKTFVEIGVYGGASFIPVVVALDKADLLEEAIAIDPWSLDVNLLEHEGLDKEWWANNPDLNPAKESFLKKITDKGIATLVSVLECTSDDAIEEVEELCGVDMLHIDGGHDYQALIDAYNYLPLVRKNGLIVFDDFNWLHDGFKSVEFAIKYLESRGCKRLPDIQNCAFLIKD